MIEREEFPPKVDSNEGVSRPVLFAFFVVQLLNQG